MSTSVVTAPVVGHSLELNLPRRARALRVLTLTPFFPSAEDPTQGGFIAEPLACMQRLGVSQEVIAVQPFYRGSARPAENAAGTWKNYACIPGNLGLPVAGKFLAASLMPTILRQHRKAPFDLIHAHAALPCGHAAAVIADRLSIPFVVSVHGLDAFFTSQTGAVIGSWCKRVAENVYRSAAAVICISEKVREQVLSALPASTKTKTAVIYNGVDLEMFYPGMESKSPQVVLSVGNLIAIKGHASLLRAFACVSVDVPNCVLEIIGDGPERGKLSQLAVDLGIAARVQFRGRQSRNEVAVALRRCAVFALPSTFEGLGCVYLEAMACAKPAIGCWGQGIEEIIAHGKTGILVAPGNEAELSDSLRALLLDNNLRRRLGVAAREAVIARLTLDHQARQLAEIYRGCAA
jgi:glycosyltransferase involved in cell wall biosynthesis